MNIWISLGQHDVRSSDTYSVQSYVFTWCKIDLWCCMNIHRCLYTEALRHKHIWDVYDVSENANRLCVLRKWACTRFCLSYLLGRNHWLGFSISCQWTSWIIHYCLNNSIINHYHLSIMYDCMTHNHNHPWYY